MDWPTRLDLDCFGATFLDSPPGYLPGQYCLGRYLELVLELLLCDDEADSRSSSTQDAPCFPYKIPTVGINHHVRSAACAYLSAKVPPRIKGSAQFYP